jgi:Mn-dependent DtxR family transcriptional regulator
MKKKLSDIVFQRISPPDTKTDLSVHDLSHVIVRRIGLKRKESRAKHDKLLLELIKYRKENIPMEIEKISQILEVSQSQTYEEIRKWRTLGLLEFVKIPSGVSFAKGYMLTAPTVNRLLDKVESSTKSFMRKTRRIAKDFDDLLMLEVARSSKDSEKPQESTEKPIEKPGILDENEDEDENEEDLDEE